MQIRLSLGALVAGFLITSAAMGPAAYSEPRADVAPQGKLRVAFLLGPIYATKDRSTGELKGVAIDLGQALAGRIGVPFEPITYATLPEVLAAASTGAWDVALMGINRERAALLDFSPPYMEVEQGYLVRADIQGEADVDKDGVRIGVLEKAGADVLLSRALKKATLVRAANVSELFALLDTAKVDVIAATKTALFAGAGSRQGLRVLDGSILVEPIGIGIPKGRSAAAAYVEKFVKDAKAEGLVKSAIEWAGLRGVVVGPN
ncbi:polar amino acid transport system substrate-binding protein [Bradyrhizobium japonicum]